MLVKEKKETKKEKKREKIIEAAAELFSHRSYHEVMMEDVAKLTDVAKGTVYNYFTSKEELYFSIMKIRMEKLINSVKEKISSESNSINSLHSFITHIYMFMMKYQSFFLIYQKESLDSENLFCEELRNLESQIAPSFCPRRRSATAPVLIRADNTFPDRARKRSCSWY